MKFIKFEDEENFGFNSIVYNHNGIVFKIPVDYIGTEVLEQELKVLKHYFWANEEVCWSEFKTKDDVENIKEQFNIIVFED